MQRMGAVFGGVISLLLFGCSGDNNTSTATNLTDPAAQHAADCVALWNSEPGSLQEVAASRVGAAEGVIGEGTPPDSCVLVLDVGSGYIVFTRGLYPGKVGNDYTLANSDASGGGLNLFSSSQLASVFAVQPEARVSLDAGGQLTAERGSADLP